MEILKSSLTARLIFYVVASIGAYVALAIVMMLMVVVLNSRTDGMGYGTLITFLGYNVVVGILLFKPRIGFAILSAVGIALISLTATMGVAILLEELFVQIDMYQIIGTAIAYFILSSLLWEIVYKIFSKSRTHGPHVT